MVTININEYKKYTILNNRIYNNIIFINKLFIKIFYQFKPTSTILINIFSFLIFFYYHNIILKLLLINETQ